MNGRITSALALVLAVSATVGCSTKNYGRQPELTSFEKQSLTCREIDLEQAKVQGFLAHVREESEFDGRSVLSFLGDFGIGNLMEKDSAIDSANQRMAQLNETKLQRGCTYANNAPASSYPTYSPAPAPAQVSPATASRESQLEELRATSQSYEEYQRRYREITGQ